MSNVHICQEHNDYVFGIAMKEAVRRAVSVIRRQRFTFEAQAKEGLSGAMDDLVTTADIVAQETYVKTLGKAFPAWGIVAEENGLSVACRMEGTDAYFTVDPLDGTKAFARGQWDGVGTMISAVVDGRVIAAFVGDAGAPAIYGYRPNSPHVHRVGDFDTPELLRIDGRRPLAEQKVLVRMDLDMYGPLLRRLLHPSSGSFRSLERVNGSIGIGIARMWKGEVGGAVMARGVTTPWDLCPIIGISERLGFVFLRCTENDLVPYKPVVSKKIERVDFDTLIVHESRVEEARNALRRIKA